MILANQEGQSPVFQVTTNAVTVLEEKALRHLLRRTLLSATRSDFEHFRHKEISTILSEMLGNSSFHAGLPLKNYNSVNCRFPDSTIGIGETWIEDVNNDPEVNQKRIQSLAEWYIGLLFSNFQSLKPRLSLFWHQYFPVQFQHLRSAREGYDYLSTLIHHSADSFPEIIEKVFLHRAFLNGQFEPAGRSGTETVGFTTSLLSRFLFGSDCRNFLGTEELRQFSLILFHYSKSGSRSGSVPQDEVNYMITRLSQEEKVIDLFCRRFYQSFVYTDLTGETPKRAISRLKEVYWETKGGIRELVDALIQSNSFQHPQFRGALPKNPLEYLFSLIRHLHLLNEENNFSTLQYYDIWKWLAGKLSILGFNPGYPPSEKGWPSFNQAPFHRHWSSPSMLYEKSMTLKVLLQEGVCLNTEIRKARWEKELERTLPVSFEKYLEQVSTDILPLPLPPELLPEISQYLLSRNQMSEKKWNQLVQGNSSTEKRDMLVPLIADTYNFLFSLPEYHIN